MPVNKEPTDAIKSLEMPEPMREGEYGQFLCVGYGGVTHIAKREAYRGDHSEFWFDIFKGDKLAESWNERHVARVEYMIEESE